MRVLVVDLNNFSRYPTMSVGLIAGILRGAGIGVDVLSPFALGIEGYPRTVRPPAWGLAGQALRFWSATTRSRLVRQARAAALRSVRPPREANHEVILRGVEERLEVGAEVVLISAYTMYFEVSRKICALAQRYGRPVLVGGNAFCEPEIVGRWLGIPGLSAVFGGEPEPVLVDLVVGLAAGRDVSQMSGVSVAGRPARPPAPPLRDLDALPFPDYSDFPWHRYPNRIVPMMAGRGCGWGACAFCGDVVTSAGRRFRTRTPHDVLEEMRHQHGKHETDLFTFLDLKLNSSRAVWKALAEETQRVVPGARWTASLHVDARSNDDLEARDLREARRGGLVRITTGLESASPLVLKGMAKGTDPERTSEVLHHAHEAGISVRLTVLVGYPGEQAGDVEATARYLERHRDFVDRVVVNRLAIMPGSGLARELRSHPERFPEISDTRLDLDSATIDHWNESFVGEGYRRAIWGLLRVVHRINRKPLTGVSREFEGVM